MARAFFKNERSSSKVVVYSFFEERRTLLYPFFGANNGSKIVIGPVVRSRLTVLCSATAVVLLINADKPHVNRSSTARCVPRVVLDTISFVRAFEETSITIVFGALERRGTVFFGAYRERARAGRSG